VRQPYVDDLAARFASDCTIIRHGSPELVELAEARFATTRSRSTRSRRPRSRCSMLPKGERIDTVVLACTHFPLLFEPLRAAFPGVTYVDGAPALPVGSPI
jgi:glutamate racemase